MVYPTMTEVKIAIEIAQAKDNPRKLECINQLIIWWWFLPYPGTNNYGSVDDVYLAARNTELEMLFLIHNELRFHTEIVNEYIIQGTTQLQFIRAFEDYLATKEPEEANDDRPIPRTRHILEGWGMADLLVRQHARNEIATQKAERNKPS